MYWADEGGFGVPPKIGKANMDGTNPTILLNNNAEVPTAITIDLETKIIYYSTQFPSTVSIDLSEFQKLYDVKLNYECEFVD